MMRDDGAITDLVHTVEVPVPRGREAYLEEMKRIAGEMERTHLKFPRCSSLGVTDSPRARF